MKQFEYDTMSERAARIENVFEFKGQKFYDFLSALNALGLDGWEWIGTNEERYIFKREIVDEDEL